MSVRQSSILASALLSVLLVFTILLYLNFFTEDEDVGLSYPIQKVLRYSFNLRNTSDQFIKHSTFKAFAPVQRTSSQWVESLEASHPYVLKVDQL